MKGKSETENQDKAVRILQGLNLRLNSQGLKQAEQGIREQQEISSPPAERWDGLRMAILVAICSINENASNVEDLLRAVRRQLDEDNDEVASMSRQYKINGGVIEFTPRRR